MMFAIMATNVVVANASVSTFSDINSDDTEIMFLSESNVVQGVAPGQYAPEKKLNRVELLKILLESIGISPNAAYYKNCFPDVNEEWFAKYVCYAKEKGIVKGYDDGNFRPGNEVNLAEALKMTFNTFDFVMEDDMENGQWYSKYLSPAKNYDVVELYRQPGDLVDRRLMAKLVVKIATVGITGQRYDAQDFEYFRRAGVKIQDLSLTDHADINGLEAIDIWQTGVGMEDFDDSWIVKIKSDDGGESFEIKYGHHSDSFMVDEDSEEIDLPPTIYVADSSGVAHIGLNADFEWDGVVSTVSKSAQVDADLFGYFPESINLLYEPDKRLVKIYSALGEFSATFNLRSGAVSGDEEITQGISNLRVYFNQNDDQPFRVCVSDGAGMWGEVGIFADLKTVGVRECPTRQTYYEGLDPIEIRVVNPIPSFPLIVPKQKFPIQPPVQNPPGGGGQGNKPQGGGNPGRPGVTYPGSGALEPVLDGEGPLGEPVTTGHGEDWGDGGVVVGPGDSHGDDDDDPYGVDDGEPFPEPDHHPGLGYEVPQGSSERFGRYADRVHGSFEEAGERCVSNREAIEEGIDFVEDMLEELGLSTPEMPSFDPGVCCDEFDDEGNCCDDLDLSTEEGRKAFIERVNCLVDKFWDASGEMHTALASVNFLTGHVNSLEVAEANMRLLSLFVDFQKSAMHIVIDVATGGGGWISGFLSSAIGEVFGGEYADIMNGDIESLAQGEIDEMMNEITGYDEKVGEIGGMLADKMGLDGSEKERFIENIKDKFSGSPQSLFNGANWLKAISDAIMDSVGGAADDFSRAVEMMRQKRNDDLKEAWRQAQLLKQINEALCDIRGGDCGDKFLESLDDEKDRLEGIEQEYRERIAEDSDYLLDALTWLMNHNFSGLVEGSPSPNELKQRLLTMLKNYLCDLGYDLCWVDIHFKIKYEKTENGWSWEIYDFYIIKRSESKEDCECPRDRADYDEEDEDDEDDRGSGSGPVTGDDDDDDDDHGIGSGPATSDDDDDEDDPLSDDPDPHHDFDQPVCSDGMCPLYEGYDEDASQRVYECLPCEGGAEENYNYCHLDCSMFCEMNPYEAVDPDDQQDWHMENPGCALCLEQSPSCQACMEDDECVDRLSLEGGALVDDVEDYCDEVVSGSDDFEGTVYFDLKTFLVVDTICNYPVGYDFLIDEFMDVYGEENVQTAIDLLFTVEGVVYDFDEEELRVGEDVIVIGEME